MKVAFTCAVSHSTHIAYLRFLNSVGLPKPFDLSQVACFLPYRITVLLIGLSFFLEDPKACVSVLSKSVPVDSVLLTLFFCTSAIQ